MARLCLWCKGPIPEQAPPSALFCRKKCRQTHWRARAVSLMEGGGESKRIAYGDPPYPDHGDDYADQETGFGEVDHRALLAQLVRHDGWALSTSSKALRDVLPLCPPGARVASWVKPIGASSKTRGPHSRWEPVIYMPARWLQPGKVDWLLAKPARGGDSTLLGRKPMAFYRWLFELLGMQLGDSFFDMYPGSQMGSRCWRSISDAGPRPSSRVHSDAAVDAAERQVFERRPGVSLQLASLEGPPPPLPQSSDAWRPCCGHCGQAFPNGPGQYTSRCPACGRSWDGSERLPDGRVSNHPELPREGP